MPYSFRYFTLSLGCLLLLQLLLVCFAIADDRAPFIPDTGIEAARGTQTVHQAGDESTVGTDLQIADTHDQFMAVEEGWSIGAGVGVSESPYKSYDVQWMPLPIISYEGEYFYIRGLAAGLKLLNYQYLEVSTFVGYDGTSFDTSDTSNSQMKKLKNRHSSAVAGMQARVVTPVGMFQASGAADILGKSNGFKGEVEYNYSIEYEPVELVLTGGMDWSTSRYQNYYYGVSGNESSKSGLEEYRPGAGVSPYVGASLVVSPTDSVDIFCSGQVNFLNDNIKDSPMVGKERTHSVTGGLIYNF